MNILNKPLIALSSMLSGMTLADVSVHVLDTNKGQPGANIPVEFYEKVDKSWKLLSSQLTDNNGRVANFKLGQGVEYRVIFSVESFFKEQDIDTFYKEIPVDFSISDKKSHYHIPLLLSPYGYSTYRGN